MSQSIAQAQKVALERPVPRTDAALYMPALAHEVQERLDIILGHQILDLKYDRSAS